MALFFTSIFLLVAVIGGATLYTKVSPATLVVVVRWMALLVAGGLGLFIIVRAPSFAPLLLIASLAIRALIRANSNPRDRAARMAGRQRAETSQTATAHLRMHLDHATGALDGDILTGGHRDRRLSDLTRSQLMQLWSDWRSKDVDTLALLRAYLDRTYPGWDQEAPGSDDPHHTAGATSDGPMTVGEAWQILGLEPGASTEEIKQAARDLLKRVHPDVGGSTYLAAKINRARDLLVKDGVYQVLDPKLSELPDLFRVGIECGCR